MVVQGGTSAALQGRRDSCVTLGSDHECSNERVAAGFRRDQRGENAPGCWLHQGRSRCGSDEKRQCESGRGEPREHSGGHSRLSECIKADERRGAEPKPEQADSRAGKHQNRFCPHGGKLQVRCSDGGQKTEQGHDQRRNRLSRAGEKQREQRKHTQWREQCHDQHVSKLPRECESVEHGAPPVQIASAVREGETPSG